MKTRLFLPWKVWPEAECSSGLWWEHNPPACIRQCAEWLSSFKVARQQFSVLQWILLSWSHQEQITDKLLTIFMPTAWFLEEMSMEKCSWLWDPGKSDHTRIGASKTQCTNIQKQFVDFSFKVKFGRPRFKKKRVSGSWVPPFFSAQIEIFQKTEKPNSTKKALWEMPCNTNMTIDIFETLT